MATDQEKQEIKEMQDTLRQMLKDWDAATPAQREAAVNAAERAAR